MSDVTPVRPVRKSAQRVRWFIETFNAHLGQVEAETANRFVLDERALVAAFSEWIHAFDAQKPGRSEDREAFVGFAAGLMLRSLLRHAPARCVTSPEGADPGRPAHFWPEGHLYVTFCLKLRGLVLEQDFHARQAGAPAVLDDLRAWESFRENVAADSRLAVAFLDLFAGADPDWHMPGLFRPRPGPALGPGKEKARLEP
ncbi:MAG: hypothetical protein KatS3mg118_1414 [Paracoccaceae bacterium]|nr:MAG: hypothetical protein KatS3mg118_1414 [Paracoccaceae bacterium]